MLVRTPAIRLNAAAEIHLFTASVADRMGTWQGKIRYIFYNGSYDRKYLSPAY